VFSFNNLPFLLVLLICWSVAIALISAFIAIAIRRTIALARQLRKSR
jgi:hypothetical protein